MLDVALVWNSETGTADLAMNGPDLQMDAGLQTPVILSLFTDQLADAADWIPDGTTNRRGYWGDAPLPNVPEQGKSYLIGSKLWLLDRALQTQDTLNRAESYARQALQWMIDDGVVGSLTATASFPQLAWIDLQIDLFQAGSQQTFSFAWQNS
jgi:phage gp46-like protein